MPLLLGLAPSCDEPSSTFAKTATLAPTVDDEDYSVVVAGHLYSLFVAGKDDDPKPPIGWRAPIETFAAELERIEPKLIFLLGDSTRFGNVHEYAFLDEAFIGLEDRLHYAAGNHEYRNIEAFKEHGGLINTSIVYHGNKYVILDAKSILEEHDLDFLRREFADADSYDHVFLMTHLFLADRADVEGPLSEIDPYEAYAKQSNWNRDVVPIIEGKVDVVFYGDYNNGKHVMNKRVGEQDKEILYVSTAFLFGRGQEAHIAGDGPMLFLELRFSGDELQILPRTIPLDVRHDWYAIPTRPAQATTVDGSTIWERVPLPDSDITLGLPSTWIVQDDSKEGISALGGSLDQWQRVEFRLQRFAALDRNMERDMKSELSAWKQNALARPAEDLKFDSEGESKDLALQAFWMVTTGRKGGRNVVQWSVLLKGPGDAFELTLVAPLSKRAKYVDLMAELLPRITLAKNSGG